ncbi:hypothetical protein H4R27_005856, partial [Coemansia aciculifera]
MRERLASLELHKERVQSTIEWMREVDKTKEDPKHMTTVSYEKPKRLTGVPQFFDKSCEFSNIESRPESLVSGRVISFRRKTLDDFADEMMEMFDKAIEYQRSHSYSRSYMAYACLHIWVGGQRRLGTRAIGIGPKNMKEDLDYLYNVEFANLIESIKQGEHFYEVVFESDSPCYVHFYFKVNYYPEPGCVANWGEGIDPVEKLKLFDLFTASESNEDDCILQCARRIWPVEKWGKEATEDCIAKLISRAEGKIVILTPRAYVRYIGGIHTYGDLAIDQLSPIKTQSVIDPDYIYLLHWKGHIGVMENMKTEIAVYDILIRNNHFISFKFDYDDVVFSVKDSEGTHADYGHVGYCWHNRGKIFKDYICNVLYRLKQQYEQAGNMEKRQVIKIIMNSLWGKFAQKWMDTRYEIVREEDAELNKECYKIWDTDHMLTKTHKNKKFASKPVQNGVFTLSWARYHMKLLWDAIARPGAECIYSDTDSMMVRSEQIRTDSTIEIEGKTLPVIGSNMGQLECEHHFDDL